MVTPTWLFARASEHLRMLCVDIPTRQVGSAGNRAATAFFAERAASFGFEVASPPFDCMDWREDGADLTVAGESFDVRVSPYSLAGRAAAPLAVVSSLAELETAHLAGRVVLLRGAIAAEQLMPKNFPFYNPDEHKRIIGLLEKARPHAIVAATARNPQMAGAVYPFPLFEDGDFDIPSVYLTDEAGDRLAAHAGEEARLEIRASRLPATGCNVIARKGAGFDPRVVLFAHIDAKEGSPGAIDNAAGVAVLLLLAELLADYAGRLGMEIVAMNGEDYYSNPGELHYLAANADRFGEISLGINLDGLGYHRGQSAYSLYGCPDALAARIRRTFAAYGGLMEGEPWYQSDHFLFIMHERPALAITSEHVAEILAEIAHSPHDRPEVVDPARLAEVALGLRELLIDMGQSIRL